MASKCLSLGLFLALACDGGIVARDSCQPGQPATGNDVLSMLQTARKRGAEAIPDSALALLDPMARAEAVIDSTEASEFNAEANVVMLPASFAQGSLQSLLNRAFDIYKRNLESMPHLTNAIVAYVITTMGDASAQLIQAGSGIFKHGFDVRRNMALAWTASLYQGLILTTWLLAINRTLPGTSLRFVMGKLAATQTILQPLVYVPFFFVVHGIFCGQTLSEIRTRLRSDYFALLFRLWSLFYPTRFLMFWIVPARYQVLWDSTVAFIWQVALSLHLAYEKNRRLGAPSQKGSLPWLLKTRADLPAAEGGEAADVPSIEQ